MSTYNMNNLIKDQLIDIILRQNQKIENWLKSSQNQKM